MPHNVSLQHCILELFAAPNFYSFVQLFVGECKIVTVIGINVTYTSISSVAEAPKRLNEGTCLKRLHHFKMYSSCREAVEDAHVAYHLASSNPNKDGAHKIDSTSSEGRSRSHCLQVGEAFGVCLYLPSKICSCNTAEELFPSRFRSCYLRSPECRERPYDLLSRDNRESKDLSLDVYWATKLDVLQS